MNAIHTAIGGVGRMLENHLLKHDLAQVDIFQEK